MVHSRKYKKKRGDANSACGDPCIYCKRKMLPTSYLDDIDPVKRLQTISVEHIIPRSKGGTNEDHNLTYACARCNSMRGSLDFELFMMFARHVLQKYPNENSILLRSALIQFVTSLAELAIRNRKASNRAISLSLLHLKDEQNKAKGIYR